MTKPTKQTESEQATPHQCPTCGCDGSVESRIADERVKQADKLASEIHDAIYAEPFDRQVASDAVWKLHELLRSNPQAEMRKDDD